LQTIVRHDIDFSRDEERSGEVVMEALMEQLEMQQVGGGSGGGSGSSFALPEDSGHAAGPTAAMIHLRIGDQQHCVGRWMLPAPSWNL
jgi:hypothetical protein